MDSDVDTGRWLEACRRAVRRQKAILADFRGRDLTHYVGVGAGGDQTLELDRAFEEAVFLELAEVAEPVGFAVISEERGGETIGKQGPTELRVVVDPIDGSENAKRGIPCFSLSVAVATGATMQDVEFGYVYDFGTGEEWAAFRGAGAFLNGDLLDQVQTRAAAMNARENDRGKGIGLVALEAAEPTLLGGAVASLAADVYLIRVIGSIAITLAHLATGRIDAMFTAGECKSVDAAAGQLIAREAGAEIRFENLALSETELTLDRKFRLVGAREQDALDAVVAAQQAAAFSSSRLP
ncbi:MAG: inositol monophosphatase family protein [Solirubrobacterales bacterium]